MIYPVLLTLHLLAALVFIGTVFFEVLILENVRKHLPHDTMREVERAVGNRARALISWVLLVLYSAGVGMAWQHRTALEHPFASSFGLLLSLKIVLAIGVFGHFLTAMAWRRRGQLRGRRSRLLHLSVFAHVVAIVLLAKAMLYLH
jgi:hypothetical protein